MRKIFWIFRRIYTDGPLQQFIDVKSESESESGVGKVWYPKI